jgi:hypothetical protein
MMDHETHCYFNPAMKACQSCGNLNTEEMQRFCEEFAGDWEDFKKIDCPKWKPERERTYA